MPPALSGLYECAASVQTGLGSFCPMFLSGRRRTRTRLSPHCWLEQSGSKLGHYQFTAVAVVCSAYPLAGNWQCCHCFQPSSCCPQDVSGCAGDVYKRWIAETQRASATSDLIWKKFSTVSSNCWVGAGGVRVTFVFNFLFLTLFK